MIFFKIRNKKKRHLGYVRCLLGIRNDHPHLLETFDFIFHWKFKLPLSQTLKCKQQFLKMKKSNLGQ